MTAAFTWLTASELLKDKCRSMKPTKNILRILDPHISGLLFGTKNHGMRGPLVQNGRAGRNVTAAFTLLTGSFVYFLYKIIKLRGIHEI